MDIAKRNWKLITLHVKNDFVLGRLFLVNFRCQHLCKVASALFHHSMLLYWNAVTGSVIILLLCSSVGKGLICLLSQGMINSSITR